MKLHRDKPKRPPHLDTFDFFGADLKPTTGGQWSGDCVLCGKPEHFFTDEVEGLWDCKVCGRSGNVVTFLEALSKATIADTEAADVKKLEISRGMPWSTMKQHGLGCSEGRWFLPVKSKTGRVHDLRVYDYKMMLSTSGREVQLWGCHDLVKAPRNSRVYLCEGEWDGMAMRWLLERCGFKDQIVVAVPGAGTLKKEWIEWFSGQDVVALYDNDEAGDRGAEKAEKLLKSIAGEMRFVRWPRSLKNGYDVRDFVIERKDSDPEAVLEELIGLLSPRPRTAAEGEDKKENVAILDPISWEELVETFRGCVEMSSDMEQCLTLMMAVCMSNDIGGDPLWMYLVAPPGAGKTMLIAALATSPRCVLKSTVTPHSLVSGWRGDGDKDPSLIPKLKGLTFVAKDFTEILTMPQMMQDEVFSTLRGAYDGSVSKSFGNGATREYKDCRFSMLAGVTHAIHASKTASLGERFLKFQFKKFAKKHAEAAVHAAINSVGREAAAEKTLTEATSRFLARRTSADRAPRLPDKYMDRLTALVQLVAMLRATVERDQRTGDIKYRPEPEAGTRLAKQLAKLAMLIAVVREKPEVDDECYSLVERVAFDTAVGFHSDIVDGLMTIGGKGTRTEIARVGNVSGGAVGRFTEDLIMLGVLKDSGEIEDNGGRPAKVYTITPKLADLWHRAKGTKPCTVKFKLSRPSTGTLQLRRKST